MPSISRAEGYRRSAGKEEPALRLAERFLRDVIGVDVERIVGPDENYRLGDLRLPSSGATIEVKGQPVDPMRYPRNFVEVFEVVGRGRRQGHLAGFKLLHDALGISADECAVLPVRQRRRGRALTNALGRPERLSFSLQSVFGSAATIYVNTADAWIYFYSRDELVDHVRVAAAGGFERGMGRSNDDTHAVLVPVARSVWREAGGGWAWHGSETERDAIVRARKLLGTAD